MTMLTTGDVARLTGLSKPTVVRAALAGRLRQSMVTPGGHRRFTPAEVDRFLRGLRVTG